MRMTSMKDIQKKNDKDLAAFVEEKREEARSFRFSTAGAGTRDVRAVRTAKREIARGLTEFTTRARNTKDAK